MLKVTPLYVNASVKLNVSIFAVPSINKSFHCFVVVPISKASSAFGIIDEETLISVVSPVKLIPSSNVLPTYCTAVTYTISFELGAF